MSTLFGYEVVEQAQEIDRLSTENASLTAEIERLREALTAIMPYTATQSIGCHGAKCRESWCYSCNDEDEAAAAANAGQEAYSIARAALQPKEGE